MALKAVLFDLDGTLADSNQAIRSFLEDTFEHYGLAFPPDHAIHSIPLKELIISAAPSLSPEKLAEVFDYGRQRSHESLPHILLMPGAEEVLRSLAGTFRLGVVTSRGRESTETMLEQFGIKDFFESVITRDDVMEPKPHPEGILKVLDFLALSAGEALYIGDGEADMEAGRRAEVASVLISKVPQPFTGDYVLSSISELPALIKTLAE